MRRRSEQSSQMVFSDGRPHTLQTWCACSGLRSGRSEGTTFMFAPLVNSRRSEELSHAPCNLTLIECPAAIKIIQNGWSGAARKKTRQLRRVRRATECSTCFSSVLVDTYNHERLIEKALRRVLGRSQRRGRWFHRKDVERPNPLPAAPSLTRKGKST